MVDVKAATQAYANALGQVARNGGGDAAGKAGGDPAQSFAALVSQAVGDTAGAVRHSEQATIGSVTGKADITDVVTAVNNAEMALDTVVAVRDKIITAYQEILRMPI